MLFVICHLIGPGFTSSVHAAFKLPGRRAAHTPQRAGTGSSPEGTGSTNRLVGGRPTAKPRREGGRPATPGAEGRGGGRGTAERGEPRRQGGDEREPWGPRPPPATSALTRSVEVRRQKGQVQGRQQGAPRLRGGALQHRRHLRRLLLLQETVHGAAGGPPRQR